MAQDEVESGKKVGNYTIGQLKSISSEIKLYTFGVFANKGIYFILDKVIKTGSRIAITISEKI